MWESSSSHYMFNDDGPNLCTPSDIWHGKLDQRIPIQRQRRRQDDTLAAFSRVAYASPTKH
jgi:hypothetical protein